ncbi:hypothetical protein PsalN5692_01966 [Piscirickettsia salmonis]|nr:hypothetical protein [Piscirickettsia salmonis]QGP50501.1 hypothetical protein PsalN5692_01966 [Piscirickettsia salmonis]
MAKPFSISPESEPTLPILTQAQAETAAILEERRVMSLFDC